MRPCTRAFKLWPKQNSSIAFIRLPRLSCRPPPSIAIARGSYKRFSMTAHLADFREQHQEQFEKLVEQKYVERAIKNKRREKRVYGVYFGLTALGVALCLLWAQFSESGVFHGNQYVRFTITGREQISSTAFILTVRPQRGPPNRATVDPYKEDWEKGGWTVRIAQPEMQIAREYTPLPPSESCRPDELRFLIRRVDGGEVSIYLSKLRMGSPVMLQRNSTSIPRDDVANATDIVYLAGGTGIVPALQMANALYGEHKNEQQGGPKMHIVWANRKREDCLGGDTNPEGRKNIIVAALEKLQQRHPDRLSIEYMVDEERTFIDEKKIKQLATPTSSPADQSKVIFVCGSEGFMRYMAGSTSHDDQAMGYDVAKTGRHTVSGGVLSRVDHKGWDILKMD